MDYRKLEARHKGGWFFWLSLGSVIVPISGAFMEPMRWIGPAIGCICLAGMGIKFMAAKGVKLI